jgi:hypothetical protein
LRFSLGSLGGGIATSATSGTWVAFNAVYLGKGGSFATATGPLLFGLGGLGLGIYQLAAGGDLASIQLDFARAVRQGDTPRMLLDTFEPRLRDASYAARSRRQWYAGTSLVFAALSAAAGAFLAVAPPPELRSGAYPTVMFGLGGINALAGLATLIEPTPTETAWQAYVHGTTR